MTWRIPGICRRILCTIRVTPLTGRTPDTSTCALFEADVTNEHMRRIMCYSIFHVSFTSRVTAIPYSRLDFNCCFLNLHTYIRVIRSTRWFLRRNSRYGLRAVIIGEASNPGPSSSYDSSPTPQRGDIVKDEQISLGSTKPDVILPASIFQDASVTLGSRVCALFLPPSWYEQLTDTRLLSE